MEYSMQLSTEINGTASLQPCLIGDLKSKVRGRHLVDIKENDKLRLTVSTAAAAALQSRQMPPPRQLEITQV